jgi:hypothetical protein
LDNAVAIRPTRRKGIWKHHGQKIVLLWHTQQLCMLLASALDGTQDILDADIDATTPCWRYIQRADAHARGFSTTMK